MTWGCVLVKLEQAKPKHRNERHLNKLSKQTTQNTIKANKT
jgi:hypothetical protein